MLVLGSDHYDELVRHARAEYPNEACAVLAGDGHVERVYLIPNAKPSPSYYEMDGAALDDANEDMLAQGWDLLGIFHSHVATEAEPSRTDVAKAEGADRIFPKAAYAILTLKDFDAPRLRAFTIKQGEVREIDVVVRDGNGLA